MTGEELVDSLLLELQDIDEIQTAEARDLIVGMLEEYSDKLNQLKFRDQYSPCNVDLQYENMRDMGVC